MRLPTATYRLQFREGMTFARAGELAPYWRELGISHLYASPIFAAAKDSTHGYDIIDQNLIEPALGGEEGFRAMVDSLRREGLGLILDVVPNHMAASTENGWWRDVLRHGRESRYAGHFDIDWEAGPLTLPFLGRSFEDAARGGELAVEEDEDGPVLRYYEAGYPLNEAAARLIAEGSGGAGAGADLQSPDFLKRLHELQHWRLADWRTGRHSLTYRRFFEITGLVGLRVEETGVFEEVHAKLFALVAEGLADGVRIDHVDGLADPTAYLRRLRDRLGEGVYLIVEKILEADETLPEDWPVQGTTGYEFIADLAALLTESGGASELDEAWRSFAEGGCVTYEAEAAAAKRDIISHNLAAEFEVLSRLAERACGRAWDEDAPGREDVAPAIAALAARFPVYRSYVSGRGASARDRRLIAEVVRRAVEAEPHYAQVIEAIGHLLVLDVPEDARAEVLRFTTRFQQTTGAVMAKAVEDTAFYRFNRLIALNEVGGSPDRLGGGAERWHERMARRAETVPHGLSATATHDTKRGEDARARLYTISEAPGLWREHVERWDAMLEAPEIDGGTRWLLFQALLGVWPAEGQLAPQERGALSDRFCAYALKAVREAKRHTSWSDPDEAYEKRVEGFSKAMLSEKNKPFRRDFAGAILPFLRAGMVNSLTQLLCKLTAPGIPDIYQGTEAWDLSLVDPDNRRAPDFDGFRVALQREASPGAEKAAQGADSAGLLKLRLLAEGLRLRAEMPGLFNDSTYRPLQVEGPQAKHVLAFAREGEGDALVAVAPRAVLGRVRLKGPLTLDREWLSGTRIRWRISEGARFRNVLTGESVESEDAAELLSEMPVALLVYRPAGAG